MGNQNTQNLIAILLVSLVFVVGVVATYTIAHGGDNDRGYYAGDNSMMGNGMMSGGMGMMGGMMASQSGYDNDMMGGYNGMMDERPYGNQGEWAMPCHQEIPRITGTVSEIEYDEYEIVVQTDQGEYGVHIMGNWIDSQGNVIPASALLEQIEEGDNITIEEGALTPCGMIMAWEITVNGNFYQQVGH